MRDTCYGVVGKHAVMIILIAVFDKDWTNPLQNISILVLSVAVVTYFFRCCMKNVVKREYGETP